MSQLLVLALGAGLGAVLAELHSSLQGERERRRALRTVLFTLLNLRFEVSRMDADFVLGAMRAYVARRFGSEAEKAMDTAEGRALFAKFVPALLSMSPDAGLAQRYRESVAALSSHAPILAYELGGRERLLQFSTQYESYVQHLIQIIGQPPTPDETAIIDQARQELLTLLRRQALEELSDSIDDLAGALWTYTQSRARRAVERQDEPLDVEPIYLMLDHLVPDGPPAAPPQGAA